MANDVSVFVLPADIVHSVCSIRERVCKIKCEKEMQMDNIWNGLKGQNVCCIDVHHML
jgi:hypothetical protein